MKSINRRRHWNKKQWSNGIPQTHELSGDSLVTHHSGLLRQFHLTY